MLNALRMPEVRRIQGKEKPPGCPTRSIVPKMWRLSKDNLCNRLFYAFSSVMVSRIRACATSRIDRFR